MVTVESTGHQLDRCDEHGGWVHKHTLRRMLRRWNVPIASNYMPYSRYNSSGWTCDSSDKGEISLGPLGHNSFAYPDSDNDVQEKSGSQTWEGSGNFRSNSAVDVSSFTSFSFSAQVGCYHYGDYHTLTVVAGFCDSAGANKSQQGSWSVNGSRDIWFTATPSDIASPLSSAAAYFYFDVTCADSSQQWYIDMIRLEKNLTRPSNTYLGTNGAAIDYTTDKVKLGVGKICPDCRERLKSLTNPPVIKVDPETVIPTIIERP